MESIKRSGQRLSYPPCVFFGFVPGFWKTWEGRTPRLRCSQEKHLELHRILAKCLESGDFVPYEIAIKAECPQVTCSAPLLVNVKLGEYFCYLVEC